jgi:hypothetical protein
VTPRGCLELGGDLEVHVLTAVSIGRRPLDRPEAACGAPGVHAGHPARGHHGRGCLTFHISNCWCIRLASTAAQIIEAGQITSRPKPSVKTQDSGSARTAGGRRTSARGTRLAACRHTNRPASAAIPPPHRAGRHVVS